MEVIGDSYLWLWLLFHADLNKDFISWLFLASSCNFLISCQRDSLQRDNGHMHTLFFLLYRFIHFFFHLSLLCILFHYKFQNLLFVTFSFSHLFCLWILCGWKLQLLPELGVGVTFENLIPLLYLLIFVKNVWLFLSMSWYQLKKYECCLCLSNVVLQKVHGLLY